MKAGIILITHFHGKKFIQFTYDIERRIENFDNWNNSDYTLYGRGKMIIKLLKELPIDVTEKEIANWKLFYHNWYQGTGHDMIIPIPPEYDPEYKHPLPIEKSSLESVAKPKFRPVDQLTLNGQFIRTFFSPTIAQAETKIHASGIHRVCNKTQSHAGGYLWSWNTGSIAA